MSPLLRRGSHVLGVEVAVSAAILVLIGVLGWGSISGRSGIGALPTGDAVLGFTLGVACGLAYAGTVIYSKRLSDGGLSPLATLSMRYFLIIAVTWVLTAFSGSPGIVEALLPGLALALFGVALQSYLGQAGIGYVEPITASLLDTLSPVCAFLLQFLDGRLEPSTLTLACIVAITALVAVGVLARHRHESAAPVVPLPAPADPEALPRSA
ncbi:EamA family transporter [Actinokineospora soli]|uniref:EamA family transporter n=1 Tax=Actinokineospora soli TaxID=1048753 RepID=A0ABW2TII7_9PSEU